MPARLDEIHEVAVDGFDLLSKARSKTLEALAVVFATAREMGRDVRIRDFVLATRDHPHPRAAGSFGVGIEGHVVVDDQIGRDLAEQIAQAVSHRPLGRGGDRLPAGPDVGRDLLVG